MRRFLPAAVLLLLSCASVDARSVPDPPSPATEENPDPAGPPRTSSATVPGSLDIKQIARVFAAHAGEVKACYEDALSRGQFNTRASMNVLIDAEGRVSEYTVLVDASPDYGLANCLRGVAVALRFPKPIGGGPVSVRYPYIFKMEDQSPCGDCAEGTSR